jgi:hypothetical protein
MSREPKVYNKLIRNGNGGAKININAEEIAVAFKACGIELGEQDLEVRASGCNTNHSGQATIILRIRKAKI